MLQTSKSVERGMRSLLLADEVIGSDSTFRINQVDKEANGIAQTQEGVAQNRTKSTRHIINQILSRCDLTQRHLHWNSSRQKEGIAGLSLNPSVGASLSDCISKKGIAESPQSIRAQVQHRIPIVRRRDVPNLIFCVRCSVSTDFSKAELSVGSGPTSRDRICLAIHEWRG